LEFTLECEQRLEAVLKEATRPGAITEIVDAYWKDCADPSRVVLPQHDRAQGREKARGAQSLTELVDAVRYTAINDTFLRSAYADVAGFACGQGV